MFRTFTDVTRPPVEEQHGDGHLNRIYICDFCSDGWSSETDVEFHRSKSHKSIISDMMKDENKPICKMCMTEFMTKGELLRHIKRDHLLSSDRAIRVERDIFICSDCGDIFFNKLLLVHHIISTHAIKTKKWILKCPICFKTIRLSTCWYHFLHHKLQSVAVCKICLTKCKDRLILAEHMKCHPYIYKCDMCRYETKKKDLFDVHVHTLHKRPNLNANAVNDQWKKYYLPLKSPKTWQRISLMGWKGVKLTNDVHICVLCREICCGAESMKRHILIDHMGEPTTKTVYRCTCGIVFTSKVLYKQHMFKFKDQHNL